MKLSRKIIAAVAAVGSLAMMAGSALAAQATTTLNVRSGPSTAYAVVNVLQPGENVDIKQCQGGWCYVIASGNDGWASARYLTQGGYQQPAPSKPSVSVSIGIPNFSFSFGNGFNFGSRPMHRTGQACFYTDFNYQGRSFCVQPGQSYSSLNQFNDRISSIRISGGVQAQVCEDFNYQGRCAVIDRNYAQLNGRNNDIISSIRVR